MDLGEDETDLKEFFGTVDGLVMGRNTYDFVLSYGSWPYEDKPTWVCTSRDLQPLKGANLIVVENIDNVICGAAGRDCEHLWLVGGGQLASAFMAKGLITKVSISEMPIEFGSGIPLFSNHRLGDVAFEERNVIKKKGFRQIEIILENNGDITTG